MNGNRGHIMSQALFKPGWGKQWCPAGLYLEAAIIPDLNKQLPWWSRTITWTCLPMIKSFRVLMTNRDLNKLQLWWDIWLMKSNSTKCEVKRLGMQWNEAELCLSPRTRVNYESNYESNLVYIAPSLSPKYRIMSLHEVNCVGQCQNSLQVHRDGAQKTYTA